MHLKDYFTKHQSKENKSYSVEEVAEMLHAQKELILSFVSSAEMEPDAVKFPIALRMYNQVVPREIQKASGLELTKFKDVKP